MNNDLALCKIREAREKWAEGDAETNTPLIPFYQSCFPFRCEADVFQRHAEIVKYRVKIGERVLTHADEGV